MGVIMQKILYLYLNTGGGHISGAKALSHAMEEAHPGECENFMLDALDPKSKFIRNVVEEGYKVSVQDHPWLWPITFESSKFSLVQQIELMVLRPWIKPHLKKYIQEQGITKIVILHFLLIQLVHEILIEEGWSIPMVTVVMDPFTVHPFWFIRKDRPLVVFSHQAKGDALKHRVDPQMIKVIPLMLRRHFERPMPADLIALEKTKFGFITGKKLLLLAGGGDGIPGAQNILKQALLQRLDVEIAVVCGKNAKLQAQCESMVAKYGSGRPMVRIYGFVDFMYELMNMADLVISKGGPATVMEILMLHKPLIVVNYIYGQEKGNVNFVIKNDVGHYISNPRKLVIKSAEILANPKLSQEMADKVAKLALRNGTDELREYVYNFS